MRALVFRGAGEIAVETVPVPEPGPGEVLVRVAACGICGSDAAEFDHGPVLTTPPVVLGHEFAGTVARTGPDVADLVPGATVVCGAGVSCGECRACARGRTNLCEQYRTAGLQFDGGLAEFAVVPASVLLDVSGSGLPLDTLALAQPMSIAVHAVRRSGLGRADHAVIVGAGGIGAFLIVAAAAIAERLLVVDLDPERLELARRLGAHEVMDPREEAISARLDRLGMSPDVLFEVSGSAAGLASVLAAARPGSTLVPVGIQREDVPVPLAQWTVREYAVIGTNAHVFSEDLTEAVRLLGSRDDWSEVAPLALPLELALAEGLEPLRAGRSTRIKTLIDPRTPDPRPADHRRN
jgi:threonine dehydrogenase-like Zn-dependent dehydrogenase